jgi:hypothetical protein
MMRPLILPLLIALLMLLLEPVVGPLWALVGLLTWGAVRTGLRAGVSLHGQIRDDRLRREIAAADEERAIGAAELVRPGAPPLRRGSGPAP